MEEFMKEPFDFKRFAILNVKRIWIVILTAVIFAGVFGLGYMGYRNSLPTVYRSDILYNISFDRDQVDNIHDYYNDYTWNDVLDSDAIAGKAADYTGASKEAIAASTTIPTMSDIRLIHVYVDTDSPELSATYAAALTDALSAFAAETDGFKTIEVMSNEGVSEVTHSNYIIRCTVSGLIIGLILGSLILMYISAMDTRLYIEKDVRKIVGDMMVIPVINGELVKADSADLTKAASILALDNNNIKADELEAIAKLMPGSSLADSEGAEDDKDIILAIKAGVDNSLVLYREYENLKASGKNIKAVFMIANNNSYMKYYK